MPELYIPLGTERKSTRSLKAASRGIQSDGCAHTQGGQTQAHRGGVGLGCGTGLGLTAFPGVPGAGAPHLEQSGTLVEPEAVTGLSASLAAAATGSGSRPQRAESAMRLWGAPCVTRTLTMSPGRGAPPA